MFRLDADVRVAGGALYYSVAGDFRPAEYVTYTIYDSTPNLYGEPVPGTVLASGPLSFTSFSLAPPQGAYGAHYRAEFALAAVFRRAPCADDLYHRPDLGRRRTLRLGVRR